MPTRVSNLIPAFRALLTAALLVLSAAPALAGQEPAAVPPRSASIAGIGSPWEARIALRRIRGQEAAKARFVEFFRDRVWPLALENAAFQEETNLEVHVKRFLGEVTEEQANAKKKELDARERDLRQRWIGVAREWARLAEGLAGELPELARRLSARAWVLPPELEPAQTRLFEIQSEMDRMAMDPEGPRRNPYGPIAGREAELLREEAALRTRVAKAAGYGSWAGFMLGRKETLAPELRSPEAMIAMLRQTLRATDDAFRRLVRHRRLEAMRDAAAKARAEGKEPEAERDPEPFSYNDSVYSMYLRDEGPRVVPIPTKGMSHAAIWRGYLARMGFPREEVARLAMFDRDHGAAGGVTAPLRGAEPGVIRIDAEELRAIASPRTRRWAPGAAAGFVPASQRRSADGWRITWHEGGHVLDFGRREGVASALEGLGAPGLVFCPTGDMFYTETIAALFEQIALSPEVLRDLSRRKMVERAAGRPVTDADIAAYGLELELRELVRLRWTIGIAMADLELWRAPFGEEGDEDFVARSQAAFDAAMSEAMLSAPPSAGASEKSDMSRYLVRIAHVAGGSVSYYGYALAKMAGWQVYPRLRSALEARTGRKGFVDQAAFGPMVLDALRFAHEAPYPEFVRSLTGAPYSVDELGREYAARVDAWIASRDGLRSAGCGESFATRSASAAVSSGS